MRLQNAESSAPLDLYDESLLCGDVPTCFRLSNKIVIAFTKPIFDVLEKLSEVAPGSSITNLDSAAKISRNVAPYLIVRLLVLVGVVIALKKYLETWIRVSILSSVLMLWISGIPIRAVAKSYTEIRQWLSIGEVYAPTLFDHFSRQSTVFILEHDMLAALTVVWLPLILYKIPKKKSWLKLGAVGLVSTLVFENLAIVCCVALTWMSYTTSKRRVLQNSLQILSGWVLVIGPVTVYAAVATQRNDAGLVSTSRYYFETNRDHQNLIVHFFVGFLLLPLVFGLAIRCVALRIGRSIRSPEHLWQTINGVALGLVASFVVGFFTSGLASEFGRQTLGAQILLFISGLLWPRSKDSRFQRPTSFTEIAR